MTNLEQKATRIFEKLEPFGLNKSGARNLAPLDGIAELLNEKSLPPNPMERPPAIVLLGGRFNPNDGRNDYRKGRAEYLGFWIQGIGSNHTWTVYEALIKYCNSKVQQNGTGETA